MLPVSLVPGADADRNTHTLAPLPAAVDAPGRHPGTRFSTQTLSPGTLGVGLLRAKAEARSGSCSLSGTAHTRRLSMWGSLLYPLPHLGTPPKGCPSPRAPTGLAEAVLVTAGQASVSFRPVRFSNPLALALEKNAPQNTPHM